MREWRKRLEGFLGENYAPGMALPAEVVALGARLVKEADGSDTLIAADNRAFPLREGMVITIMHGMVTANDRVRLERNYEEVPDRTAPDTEPVRTA